MNNLLFRSRTTTCLQFLILSFAILITGCTRAGPQEITYIGSEYAFTGPEIFSGGWTRLIFDNQGELAHDLMMVRVPDDKTKDDVLAALEDAGPPEWAQFYGGLVAGPGESASYIVDLGAGKYVMLSFGASADAPPDAFQGMIKEVTATEPVLNVRGSSLPDASAEINLLDFQFEIMDEILAGSQTLRVSNPGREAHALDVYRLAEGASLADFQNLLNSLMSGGEMPAEPIFEPVGSLMLSPGVTAYVDYDFESGTYVLLCSIPSPANGMQPHSELGMIREVRVP